MVSPRENLERRQYSSAAKRWLKDGWPAILLLAALVAVYWPALHGDFLWDDDDHISNNQTLRSLSGLGAIWFQPGATMQYYPLTFTAFWVGYHLWGLNPLGYHLLTLFFHCLASLLLWQVLARLKVRGAWLAGAIFALHPVNVMSVAWMTELKNTLSATLALGAVWSYVRFARLGVYAADDNEAGVVVPCAPRAADTRWRWYAPALGLFALGMLAKTAVGFVPVSLLLITWWQRQRLDWRAVWPLLPMAGFVPLFGAVSIHIERLSGAVGESFSLGFLDRVLISGRSFWFYLGKLLYPYPLAFIYERWTVDDRLRWQYLYPAAAVALFAGLWWWRGRLGRGPLVALLHFYVSTTLLILGVVLYMTRYSFVSDHWLYFGALSVIALAAAGITGGLERVAPSKSFLKRALCGLLLGGLGILSWRRASVFRDAGALWQDTLTKNPTCWLAHNNLGSALRQKGQPDEAIVQYQEAIRLKPDAPEAYNNLGVALEQKGRTGEAISQYQEAIRRRPEFAEAHNNLGIIFEKKGQIDDAINEYQEALRLRPHYAEAYYSLGTALAQKGRHDEAISRFQQAIRLNPDYALAHYTLGVALGEKGQIGEAISQFQAVLRLKPDYAEAHYSLGLALGRTGQIDGAISHLLEAIRLRPDYVEARHTLGIILGEKGQFGEAISQLREVVRLEPHDADTHCALGIALGESGQMDEAISQLQEALRLKPDSADAHYNLGFALGKKGRTDEAISHYQAALRLKPDNAMAHNKLGNALYRRGRNDEAIHQFQEALRLQPDYADARKNLELVLATKADSLKQPDATTKP